MINFQHFKNQFEIIELNYNFKLPNILLMAAYEKIKNIPDTEFKERINNILSLTTAEWKKKHGFNNQPTIADILSLFGKSEKDLEAQQKTEREKEQNVKYSVAVICAWLNDKNINHSFYKKYKDPDNDHLAKIINEFLNIKENLNNDRATKMGLYLREIYQKDKLDFYKKITKISQTHQNLKGKTLTLN